jgi:hypothetical protein
MSSLVHIRSSLDKQLALSAEHSSHSRREVRTLSREAKEASDRLGKTHSNEAIIHLMMSTASMLLIVFGAELSLRNMKEASETFQSLGTQLVPGLRQGLSSFEAEKRSDANFRLQQLDNERQAEQMAYDGKYEEIVRQLCSELMRLYAGLYKLQG